MTYKHKPMLFSDIIGFDTQKKLLRKITEHGMFSVPIIFCGIKGQGKSLFIMEIARKILTASASDAEYSKRLFDNHAHPDFLVVKDDRNSIKIEQIRQTTEYLSIKPVLAGYKIVFIDSADKMTVESANALLKTLEEPPADSVIFLSLETLEELPETILSRCVRIHFPHLSTEEIIAVSHKINPNLSEKYIYMLGEISGGGIQKDLYEPDKEKDYTELYQFCVEFIRAPNEQYVVGVSGYFNKMVSLNTHLSVFKLLCRLLVNAYKNEPAHNRTESTDKYLTALEIVIEYQKAWESNIAKSLCLHGMFAFLRKVLS